MESGNAPYVIDSSGVETRVELHHLIQREPEAMVEIGASTHDNYTSTLHGLVENGTSFGNNSSLEKQYNNFRTNYWKWRSRN